MSWHVYLVGLVGLCAAAHLRGAGIASYYGISSATDLASLAWAAGVFTALFTAVKLVVWAGARRLKK